MLLPVQLQSVDGVPAKAPDDNLISQPKDGLVCVHWYQPLFDKLFPAPDAPLPCIIMLYALASKVSRQPLCGFRWIYPTELQHVVDA